MIQLSDHFTYRRLLRFTLPSIIMMVFTSIYGVVDGFFVSNYVGETSFAAVNFIMPVLMILGCIGFMFGTGGAALISKLMGEGNQKKANETFTLVVTVSTVLGALLAVLGILFVRPLAQLLGAEGEMLESCVRYARIVSIAQPFFVLQYEFQCFFSVAEKPKLGLIVTVIAGVTNMVLDALFVAVLPWGLAGAAAATAFSQFVGGAVPLAYFLFRNKTRLRFGRFHFDGRALFKTCSNGVSEFMSNISSSLVGMLYNAQLLKYAGQSGISAYGVLMYVNFAFLSIFIGYSVGTAPIIGYHFGAKNHDELKSLLRKSFQMVAIGAAAMFAAAWLLARPLASMFVGYNKDLMAMTLRAFHFFSFSFLFAGFSIFGSAFFTALNDGLTSALISFLRTLVFQASAVLVFPILWELDGIWLSIVGAEFMAVTATVIFLIAKRRQFGY